MIWKTLTKNEQEAAHKTANNRAKKLLQKHKTRTGVAILGRPGKCLEDDIKFQGDLKEQSILCGEKLALASLTAENVILDVCQVPRKLHPKYTGRSQYPNIKKRKLVCNKMKVYHCEHLLYWGEVKGVLTILKQVFDGGMMQQYWKVLSPLSAFLECASHHIDDLSDDVKATALSLVQQLRSADAFTIAMMLEDVKKIHDQLARQMCNEVGASFRTFVRSEASKGRGGGTL